MIVHLTETELADNLHTVLARVRDEGLEVIVEQDHRPMAIIRRPEDPSRKLSECIASAAWKRAAAPIRGPRFHDLRHQAITEMAEAGASDATLIAVAATCRIGCSNTTATCAWPRSVPRWRNWKAV